MDTQREDRYSARLHNGEGSGVFFLFEKSRQNVAVFSGAQFHFTFPTFLIVPVHPCIDVQAGGS